MGNMGLCHAVRGDFDKADRAFQVAGETISSQDGGETIGNSLYNRGWIRNLGAANELLPTMNPG